MNDTVVFKGKTYRRSEVHPLELREALTALRRGTMDHLGPVTGHYPGMSQPQVYKTYSGHLIAGAVSCFSQHIDIAFFLNYLN